MGKTFRTTESFFRKPKGHRQAKAAEVRKVPPSDWDDIQHSTKDTARLIAYRMAEKGHDATEIAHRLVTRSKESKALTYPLALKMAHDAIERTADKAERTKLRKDATEYYRKKDEEHATKLERAKEVADHYNRRKDKIKLNQLSRLRVWACSEIRELLGSDSSKFILENMGSAAHKLSHLD